MNIARTILSLLVAFAVAMLPIAGNAALPEKSMDMSAMSASHVVSGSGDMSASEDMSDCCPHDSIPSDKSMNDCGCMATCVLSGFGFWTPSSSFALFLLPLSRFAPLPASTPFHSETGSPPFRPPRV
jgi:hypothetical protein